MDNDLLYRSMKISANGLPMVGETARTLGIRKGIDISVISDQVKPNTGGMSVSPPPPYNLPTHRRPAAFGGTGKDPVWEINLVCLSTFQLQYRPDPHQPNKHGFIEPIKEMPLEDYQQAIVATLHEWSLTGHQK
ncbi:MAG: hypothetical protein DRR16_01090 [Candidatus Parabeggiatoa sp. nov. 3]|nr:MAG: hypothetical protein DRR00_02085 [Gammaproteobacteria bacterium]RKZ89959.1 MAG: hypothetical protein DRR16_01090 [Gammaproteobacteria bacterium]HEW98667.1 hypothetical protein [Beggiatoa sp.]